MLIVLTLLSQIVFSSICYMILDIFCLFHIKALESDRILIKVVEI